MYPYQPASQQYELMSSIPSIMEYFYWLGSGQEKDEPESLDWSSLFGNHEELKRVRNQIQKASIRMSQHEDSLLKELIGFLLRRNDRIKIVGSESDDPHVRVPTVAFVLVGKDGKSLGKSQEFHRELVKSGKVSLQCHVASALSTRDAHRSSLSLQTPLSLFPLRLFSFHSSKVGTATRAHVRLFSHRFSWPVRF